jgi:hypothetical protein
MVHFTEPIFGCDVELIFLQYISDFIIHTTAKLHVIMRSDNSAGVHNIGVHIRRPAGTFYFDQGM